MNHPAALRKFQLKVYDTWVDADASSLSTGDVFRMFDFIHNQLTLVVINGCTEHRVIAQPFIEIENAMDKPFTGKRFLAYAYRDLGNDPYRR